MIMRMVGLLSLICTAECGAAVACGSTDISPVDRPLVDPLGGYTIIFPEETINGLIFKRTEISPDQIANEKVGEILRQIAQTTDSTQRCMTIIQSSDELFETVDSLRRTAEYESLAYNTISLAMSVSARIVASPEGQNTNDVIRATTLLSNMLRKKEPWRSIIFNVVDYQSPADVKNFCTEVARSIDSYEMWLRGGNDPGKYFVKGDQLRAQHFCDHGLPINPFSWAMEWSMSHR
jgi:hypothetical protein